VKRATPERVAELCSRQDPYQSLDSVRITEPRLEAVHDRLRAILRVVQLEVDGEPVDIDGFRLRDPSQWRGPVGPPMSELWHISTACNMRCPFCYEEGDPAGSSVLNEPPQMATMSEIEARIRLRRGTRATGIFQPLTYINEIFCNPEALDILERLRAAQPGEVVTFVTNGTYLDEPTVDRIAALRPVFFNFSVNSLDPEIRHRVLRDLQPEVAIRAIDLLAEHRVPYLGSLVCWPTIPWSDIRATVRRLDAAGCAVIRFSLGAYSKHMKGARWEREAFWREGLAVARELMDEVVTPIKVEPYHFHDPTFLPHVAGAVRSSPAARAGLRPGDLVVAVGGRHVATANQALTALATQRRAGARTTVTVQAPGAVERTVILDDGDGPFGYPYDEVLGLPGFEWGLLLVENLKFGYLAQVRRLVDDRSARSVLLCSSVLMKPVVEEMIATTGAFDGVDVEVVVPENRHFGGTVALGDLLVVDDYVAFLDEHVRRHGRPDLVVVPSSPFSLGQWRRDLTGTPRSEIARRTGLEVAFVEIKPLAG
jgi:pyruvate-formate lyase-activating enzyme